MIGSRRNDHMFGQERRTEGERRTIIVIAITSVMMVIEIAAGIAYGSMALLADGLHMGSHTAALGLAVFAYVYARRHADDERFSFGTGKVNALAGFTGAVVLAGFAVVMAIESIERFLNPVTIIFNHAIVVAIVGLVVNGFSMVVLGGHHSDGRRTHEHDHEDHNLRSAYLHVLADALTSLLAIFALLAGKYAGATWLDPAMGVVGAALVFRWSWSLLKQSARVLLDRQAPIIVKRWCNRIGGWSVLIYASLQHIAPQQMEAEVFTPTMKKGSVELLVLSLLEHEARHGYEIGKLIEARSGGRLQFRVSSLYPILCRMEERAWIAGRWVEKKSERRRRFYRLTGKGRKALRSQRETWEEFTLAVSLVLESNHA